jgi:hypothetical protein
MSDLLSLTEESQRTGIKGIHVTIQLIMINLAEKNCPYLESQLAQLEVLGDALSLMTRILNQSLKKE